MRCPNCNSANTDGSRFCSTCGRQLAHQPEFGQRKTATVLFADLVESTNMAETLDPEALAQVLGDYFHSMRSIIERHGGAVEKFIGDAVVGMFGVPVAHEDDALRAVRAGLAMQQATQTLNGEIERRHRVRLAARIGINTGEVAVAAGLRDSESLGTGHAVSVAARIEQAAGTGDVLVSATTFELVREAVQADELPALSVKGARDPLRVWRIARILETSPRGWHSGARFVGRRDQLRALLSTFDAAVSSKSCALALVAAAPGLGKSRLAAEFASQLDERATVLVGRCAPYGDPVYGPLLQITSQLANTVFGQSAVVDRAITALGGSALATPEEIAWTFRQLLDELTDSKPVLLVVEDVHWADPLLLDLLDYVANSSTGHPMMLLCLSRPDLAETRPEWLFEQTGRLVVHLEPLATEETSEMLSALETAVADPETRRRIVEAAAGVPLFIEQMVAFAVQGDEAVPPTIRALLSARIDRLPTAERVVLERAAVQGETFDTAAILALTPEAEQQYVQEQLDALGGKEFVRPDQQSPGGATFRFSHALIRDAAYEQLTLTRRADLHERYANHLAERTSGQANTVIGHHLEQAVQALKRVGADRQRIDELAGRAGSALLVEGRQAVGRKEWRRAIDLLTRAAEIFESQPVARLRVWPDLVTALIGASDFDRADLIHDRAVSESRANSDVSAELRTDVAWFHAGLQRETPGWATQMAAAAQQAIDHFGPIGDHASLARALILRAFSELDGSNLDSVTRDLKDARRHAELVDDEPSLVVIWDELGGAMIAGRTPYTEILEFAEDEVQWAQARGIAFTEADGSLGRAYALVAFGEFGRAREEIDRLAKVFAELPGHVDQHGETHVVGGTLERESGDLPAAAAHHRRAMEIFDASGSKGWWRAAAVGLANVLVEQHQLADAWSVLEEIERRGSGRMPRRDSAVRSTTAKLLAEQGELEGALSMARESVSRVEGADTIMIEARAREALARILQVAGDTDDARRELEAARDLYEAKAFRPRVELLNRELSAW